MNRISINYSAGTEAIRILHTLEGVFNGSYIQNDWCVLNSDNKKNYGYLDSVLLPKLAYGKLLNKNPTKNLPVNAKLINKVALELAKKDLFKQLSIQELKKIEKDSSILVLPALKKLSNSIEVYKGHNFEVEIIPTHFGVSMSFLALRGEQLNSKHHKIQITKRIDAGYDTILEGLSSSLTKGLLEQEYNKKIPWRESEIVSDFVTKFILNAKDFKTTLNIVDQKENIKLRSKSLEYLKLLELPTGIDFNYIQDENKLTLFNKDITKDFSPYEFRVLKTLVLKVNRTVSFDEFSKELYGVGDSLKFSFWGISKLIQRVRNKLNLYGLPENTIVNVRGIGFKLMV